MQRSKFISGSTGFSRYLMYVYLAGMTFLLLLAGLLINLADLGYDYVYTNYLSNIFILFFVIFFAGTFLLSLFLVSTKNYSFEFTSDAIIVKSYVFVRIKRYIYQDLECIYINTKYMTRNGGGNISIDIQYKLKQTSTNYFFEVNNFGKDELKAFIFELKNRSITYAIKD
ncbi:MAG: hypothetical protein ACTHJT_14430 [Cytophaga sp.]|uniref:hypothetical protein n=1 Tax=Cytophaga sp. TaxID=29535 RepID=UPI003F819A8A